MTVYVTGDTHGRFDHLYNLQQDDFFKKEDILIILGDSGINYYCHQIYKDTGKPVKQIPLQEPELNENIIYKEEGTAKTIKKTLKQILPCTIFCIHGNHEARANKVKGYKEKEWHGGTVYYQSGYENILFAKDGEIYDFEGRKYIVIGGAYSIDKEYRLFCGANWFPDEQPSKDIKATVEKNLDKNGWNIHGVLSHTCPYTYEPRELFLSGVDQSKVDDSTERWLDTIEEKLTYDVWYFGHYHGEKSTYIEKNRKQSVLQMLYYDVEKLS